MDDSVRDNEPVDGLQPVSSPRVLLLYDSTNPEIIDQAKSLRLPLGLYSLAAMLDADGTTVRVENFSTLSTDEKSARLRAYRPDYVGLSMLTLNRFATVELAALTKKLLPHAKIVAGGPHASFMPEAVLARSPAMDSIVCGEGEATFRNLIRCYENHGDPATVRGIVYRQNGRITRNESRPVLPDLSALPHPAALFAYDDLNTSRGCTYRCGFCSSSRFWGNTIRFHSVDWVAEEIELLYRNHGIRDFNISDDVFTLDRNRTIAICREIIDRRLFVRFRCMSRVNTICPDRLKWLKRAGCHQIDFGVESGSKRLLKAMGKRTDTHRAMAAFQMTRNAGIGTGCFLIVGYPGEDDRSIADTKRFVRAIRPTWCDLSSMAVYPGSPIHRELLSRRQIDEDIWFTTKDHTLFLVEDGDRDRHLRYLSDLKTDYENNRSSYDFTVSERKAVFKRHNGQCDGQCDDLGHTALELAQALSRRGSPADALLVLTGATQKCPTNPFLWHEMGQLCHNLDNPKIALAAAEKALALQPGNYDSRRLAARVSARIGDIASAAELFHLAIAGRPEKIEARIELGEMLQKLHRFEEAAEAYRSARKIDPYWPPLKVALEQCEESFAPPP